MDIVIVKFCPQTTWMNAMVWDKGGYKKCGEKLLNNKKKKKKKTLFENWKYMKHEKIH